MMNTAARTIIFQSFRKTEPADWIRICLDSVRRWTTINAFDYAFLGDEIFDILPGWYRDRVQRNMLLMSDLARVLVARRFLSQGYDRAIWIDADILVFDPASFRIDITRDVAFCREVWHAVRDGEPILWKGRVNNAVSVFCRKSSFIDFYIDSSMKIVRTRRQISSQEIGTPFLTMLNRIVPLHLLTNVGMFSPHFMQIAYQSEGLDSLRQYELDFGAPISAVNLCNSLRGRRDGEGLLTGDHIYHAVIDKLLTSGRSRR